MTLLLFRSGMQDCVICNKNIYLIKANKKTVEILSQPFLFYSRSYLTRLRIACNERGLHCRGEYFKKKTTGIFGNLSGLRHIQEQIINSLFRLWGLFGVQVYKITERQLVNVVFILSDLEHHRQPFTALSGFAPLIIIAYVS